MSNLQQNFWMFCCFTTEHSETRKPCLETLVSNKDNEVYWFLLDSTRAFLLIFSFKPWTSWLCISCYKSLLTHVFAKLLELWGEMFCSLNSFPCYYEWIKIIKFEKQFSSSIYRICINILSWKQEKFAKTLVSWSLM